MIHRVDHNTQEKQHAPTEYDLFPETQGLRANNKKRKDSG
jgi:hypothetical protein